MSVATLDDAMLLTGFGIYNVVHMLMCGVILMGMIMQSLALGYVMPAAQCDLDLTLQQRGWLAAIPFLAIILTSYMWGYFADTRGRRPVMLSSMLLSVLFTILTSFSPNLLIFAVLYFIASVFMSGSSAVVYTYLGEFNSLRHRDKMVAFGSSFVGIGTVVLPGISWLILPMDFNIPMGFITYRPWRLLMMLCALPYAVGAILLTLAPESPKFLNAVGRQDECLEVVKKIYGNNQWILKQTFPVKTLVVENQEGKTTKQSHIKATLMSMREQTTPLFRAPLLPWTFLTCFVQFGIFATTNGFYVWFPTILNSLVSNNGTELRICDVLDMQYSNNTMDQCDDTISTKTFEHSIYIGLVFSSMYIFVGIIVDLVGKKPILATILLITGLCGIGAHLVPDTRAGVVMFAIFQMCGACIGLITSVTVELFPTKHRAMAVCLSMMIGRVGSMIGSSIIGIFLQTNCGFSFYLFGGILIVNAMFCLVLPGKKKAVKSSSTDIASSRDSVASHGNESTTNDNNENLPK
ncbi:hypothetical protein ACJJTC_003977 [Scirpophaga incertulas]